MTDFEKQLDADDSGRAAPRQSAHLYAIAGLWTRRVKLGRALDPRDRLATLRCGSGEELVMLAVAHGLGNYERALHTALADHRVHGEWFSPEVTARIVAAAPLTSANTRRDEMFVAFVKKVVRPHVATRAQLREAIRRLDDGYEDARRRRGAP